MGRDLCVAVVIGAVINPLGFARTAATQIKVESAAVPAKRRVSYLKGPLFFGSAMTYKTEVDPHRIEEEKVVFDSSGGKARREHFSSILSKFML